MSSEETRRMVIDLAEFMVAAVRREDQHWEQRSRITKLERERDVEFERAERILTENRLLLDVLRNTGMTGALVNDWAELNAPITAAEVERVKAVTDAFQVYWYRSTMRDGDVAEAHRALIEACAALAERTKS